MVDQPNLFASPPEGPPGFAYADAFVTQQAERALVERLAGLPLRPFEFQGFTGKRRVTSFGWRYDFNTARFERAEPIPDWLTDLRAAAGAFAGIEPEALEQVLTTEYAPGAGIGWHRDRPVFDRVVGVSLLGPCVFRFRRRREGGFDRISVPLAAGSAYALDGPSRTDWEHSIPAVDALRYSVTFRTLRRPQAGANPTSVRMAP